MNYRIEKICVAVIHWGSCLILFLPLLVYRETLYPYIFSKIIFFRILVEILFVVWLFLIIYNKKYRLNWKNPIIFSSIIFISILFFTALMGVDFQRSFWSSQERMTGILSISHFWLWFIILASTLKEKRNWLNLIWVSLICSLFVGLYGLGQKFGWSFILKGDVTQLSSTLGNSTFLSVYAMMGVFLSFILMSLVKNRWQKIVAIIFSILNVIVMFWGASRGVALAFGLCAFLFFIFLFFKSSQKKIKFLIGVLLVTIMVLFILLPTQAGKNWMKNMPVVIKRMAGLTASVEERMDSWQIAWQGFIDKPIFGWGWENYNVIFNQYYQPSYFRSGIANTWFDHSHNQIMDFLSLTGVLGTISYLFFYGSLFFLIFKKIKEIRRQSEDEFKKRFFIFVILGLMFLAYFFQNLTVFDTPAPLIIFYFSLGLVYFLTSADQEAIVNVQIDKNFKNKDLSSQNKKLFLLILTFSVIIFLPLIIYKFNIEPWQQSRFGLSAVSVSQIDLKTGLYLYQKSLAKSVFTNQEIRVYLAKSVNEKYNDSFQNSEVVKQGIIFTIDELEKSTKEHPLDARYWLNLGRFYNLASHLDKKYLNKAENVLQKAKELSPRRQEIYFSLVETKTLEGNYKLAINLAKEAVELDPEVGESNKILGLAYLRNNNLKEGLSEIEKAEKTIDPYVDTSTTLYISTSYFKAGNTARAISLSELARDRDPNNFQVYMQLATLYKEVGDKEKSILAVKKAVELNPALSSSAEAFIKSLK